VNARLFAAADLPVDVREGLVTWAHEAVGDDRALRLVGPASLHVTLCFLGWREADDAERLAELVLACAAPARELSIGRVLWLAPGRPHVLTVGLDDPRGELAALQGRVQDALVAGAGYMPEGREFLPHVTVARVRRGERPLRRGLPPLPELAAFASPSLTLYRSQLGPGGARYEALARVDLPAA
jgi:RNA 2',3'-cyclic 3'-phosphodiesterase